MNTKKVYNLLVNLISIIAVVSVLFSLASNIYAIGEGQDDDIDAEIYQGSDTPEDPSTEPVDDGEMKIYTIEDLFFNRIPLLDANFFTETAGGKDIQKGSTIDIIRNVVKIWYISFRNVAIVVIAIVIIFAGARIAISTVAQDKANYKNMLVNWTKALVIVLVMHIIMYAVQYFNAKMLEILEQSLQNKYGSGGTSNTGQVYNTIVKRAFDVRYKIGIPGAIMYLVLTIYFVRFCFVYVRRYAGLVILTILAPLIAIKQAVLSLNGKSSNEFAKWLGDYTTTTMLQSIHALVFLTLMTSAIDLALVNIGGFVIALLMLHAVTQITVLATQIFNFNSNGGGGGSFISELLTPGADSAPLLSSSTYLSVKTWQSVGKSFKGLKDSAVRTKDAIKDSKFAEKVKDATGVTERRRRREEEIRGESAEALESTYNEDGTINIEQTRRVVRRSRRRNNQQGQAARTMIKGLKDYQGRKMFTGGVKQALAMAGGFMAIPLAVTSDSHYETGHQNLGMLLGVASTDLFIKGGNEVIAGAKGQTKKKKDKYNKVMNNVVVGNRIMDMLDDEFADMQGSLAYAGRNTLRQVNKFNINSLALKDSIRASICLRGIKKLDSSNVDKVVGDVMKRSKINIRIKDPVQQDRYRKIIRDTLLENSDAINESIRNGSIYDDELGDSGVIDNARELAKNGVLAGGNMGFGGDANSENSDTPTDEPQGPSDTADAIGPGDSPDGQRFASGSVQERREQEQLENRAKVIQAELDHLDIDRRRLQSRKTQLERKIAQLGGKSEKDAKELAGIKEDLDKLDSQEATLTDGLKRLKEKKKYATPKTSAELSGKKGEDENKKSLFGTEKVAESAGDQRGIGPQMVEGITGPKGDNPITLGTAIGEAKASQASINRRHESAKRTKDISDDTDSIIRDTEEKINDLERRISEVQRLSQSTSENPSREAEIERQLAEITRLEREINDTLSQQENIRGNEGSPIDSHGSVGTTVQTPRATAPSNSAAVRSSEGGFVDLSQMLSDRLTGQLVEDMGGDSTRFSEQARKFNTLRDVSQVSGKQGVNPYSMDTFISELK